MLKQHHVCTKFSIIYNLSQYIACWHEFHISFKYIYVDIWKKEKKSILFRKGDLEDKCSVFISCWIIIYMYVTKLFQQLKIVKMVFFMPTSDRWEISRGFFTFHVEIFSVWTSRRCVQILQRLKHEKWKGQLHLYILKHEYNFI